MATLGDLVVNLSANTTRLQQGLNRGQQSVKAFAKTTRRAVDAISGYLTLRGAFGLIQLAADAEMLERKLSVLTGSTERGKKAFQGIERFAMNTAFTLTETAEAATKLMATGVSQGDLLGTLRLLGDLSMGDVNKLGFLSKAYTDVMAKQRLMGQELRQFAEAGIPLIQTLATQYGVTSAEVLKLSEAGQISFRDMQSALMSLTKEGGQFNGMLSSMATTTAGHLQIAKEKLAAIGREIGAVLLPMVNTSLDAFFSVRDVMEDLGTVAGVVIADMSVMWRELFNELPKLAGAAMGFIMDNFAIMVKNLGASISNLFNKLDHWGKEMGEQLAFNLGLSDEKISIPEAKMQKLEKFQGFNAPEMGIAAKTLGRDIAEALESSRKSRAGARKYSLPELNQAASVATTGLPLGPMFGMNMMMAAQMPSYMQTDTRYAGGAEKGSAEAYSAILAAVSSRGSKSPEVVATEKQTKELIKNLKPEPMEPFHVIEVLT